MMKESVSPQVYFCRFGALKAALLSVRTNTFQYVAIAWTEMDNVEKFHEVIMSSTVECWHEKLQLSASALSVQSSMIPNILSVERLMLLWLWIRRIIGKIKYVNEESSLFPK